MGHARGARWRLVLALAWFVVVAGCGSTVRDVPFRERPSAPPAATPPAQPSSSVPAGDQELAQRLASTVAVAGAMTHLEALQAIADRHGGNRATPGPGYDASVDYVVGVLRAAGYDVSTPAYDGKDDAAARPRNVIAQTRSGDPGSVVVIGAHLDSVRDGPGVVDNGSGVATLLEIATRMGASAPVAHAVRFAFFGSEEEGAVGSTAYVTGLSEEDRRAIRLYLNVDMVASANAGYFVQGGKGNDLAESGPPGSAAVADVLAAELVKTGVTPEVIEFVGDDEAPFVEAGIPSAGAENGDRGRKSEEQAQAWGGRTGERFDPCYHRACDDLDNVNRVVLDHYLPAIAGALGHLATSDDKLAG